MLAKTALDGHWRGVLLVAHALRDAGFEVVMAGMARADEIAAISRDEDVDLVALNVGGHVAVVERILDALREVDVAVPVIAGGTIPPKMAAHLQERGVRCFPPGSSMADIVATATRLVAA